MNRGNFEQWMAAGGLTLGDKANARVRRILRDHEVEPLPVEVVAELDRMEEGWWREVG